MTTPIPPAPVVPPAAPARDRKGRPLVRALVLVLTAVVALVVGTAIGASGRTATSKLTAADTKLATATRLERTDISKIAALSAQLASARSQASHAMAIATSKAASRYAAREASISSLQSSLSSAKNQYQTDIGDLQASSISADGVYVVGTNIKAGTWYTPGDGLGSSGNDQCYFATLNSTNTSDISDNNNFAGSETVSLDGVYAFQISGGCTWSRTGP
jgi:hypothetical protein